MNNIIFGVYDGYPSLKTANGGLYYFMKSLRKYNSECKVVVVCQGYNVNDELRNFANEMNFEIYTDFYLEYEMMFFRFLIYKKYLDERSQIYDKVLCSDMNDVIFQGDPFGIQFEEDIYCALERGLLHDCELNNKWILEFDYFCNHYEGNKFFPGINPNKYVNNHIVCAGTVLGTYSGIKKFLDFYKAAMSHDIMFVDQGILNVYVYNFLDYKQMNHYTKSRILTLHSLSFESLKLDETGQIINDNGEKYSIIHQINRCNLPFMLGLVE
jgi:hypothetical protein